MGDFDDRCQKVKTPLLRARHPLCWTSITSEDLPGEQRELLTRLASLRGEEQHTGTAVSRTQERGGGGGFFSRLRDRFADQ